MGRQALISMTNILSVLYIGAFSLASGLFGGECMAAIEAAAGEPSGVMPQVTVLALGGAVLTWLLSERSKDQKKVLEREAEYVARDELRQEQHEQNIRVLTEIATASKLVISQNSSVIESVRNTIINCPGAKPPAGR